MTTSVFDVATVAPFESCSVMVHWDVEPLFGITGLPLVGMTVSVTPLSCVVRPGKEKLNEKLLLTASPEAFHWWLSGSPVNGNSALGDPPFSPVTVKLTNERQVSLTGIAGKNSTESTTMVGGAAAWAAVGIARFGKDRDQRLGIGVVRDPDQVARSIDRWAKVLVGIHQVLADAACHIVRDVPVLDVVSRLDVPLVRPCLRRRGPWLECARRRPTS
jgi:hypothetical protein